MSLDRSRTNSTARQARGIKFLYHSDFLFVFIVLKVIDNNKGNHPDDGLTLQKETGNTSSVVSEAGAKANPSGGFHVDVSKVIT